ncbi:MAG: hypothetical protein ACI97A_001742 [Planctomycetota bacterium]|jgi:hypothetical protein
MVAAKTIKFTLSIVLLASVLRAQIQLDPGLQSASCILSDTRSMAQTFSPLVSGIVTQVRHGVRGSGSSITAYNLYITQTDSNGLPPVDYSNDPLYVAFNQTSFANIGGIGGTVNIPVGVGLSISSGCTYALIFEPTTAGTMSHRVVSGGGSYTRGDHYVINVGGTAWSPRPGCSGTMSDMAFFILGNASTPQGDLRCLAITSPTVNTGPLGSSETVSVEFTNDDCHPIPANSLYQVDITVNNSAVLSELFVLPAFPIGAVFSYSTLGTVDLSSFPCTLEVTIRRLPLSLIDLTPANNTCIFECTPPTVSVGYCETFDDLPSNNGASSISVKEVPEGWENVSDDTASINLNTEPDWGPNNGPTGSNQGPSADHTTGSQSGIYMYIEDSPSQPGDISLKGPVLDLSTTPANEIPALAFHYFSHVLPGASDDNLLVVDIINVTTGGTVTMSVGSFPGSGDDSWHLAKIDLSAFLPDLVRPQWRTNNNNADFTDDVAIDDVKFIGCPPTGLCGQAPQSCEAVLDISAELFASPGTVLDRASNALGELVPSGAAGPYTVKVPRDENIVFRWQGQPLNPLVMLFGPLNCQIATFPGVGQLDIGSLPIYATGIPGNIFILANGAASVPTLLDLMHWTGPQIPSECYGIGGFTFRANFLPGYLATFQFVINPSGQFFISNAVSVIII